MGRFTSRRLRVSLSYFLVLVLSIAVWVVSTFALGTVMGNTQQIVRHQDRAMDSFTTLMQSIDSQHTYLYQFILSQKPENLADYYAESRTVIGEAGQIGSMTDDREQRTLMLAVVHRSREWTKFADSFVILLHRNGQVTKGMSVGLNRALNFDATIRKFAGRVYADLRRDRAKKLAASRTVFNNTELALFLLMIVVGLSIIGLAAASFAWMRQEESARRLAQGAEVKARDSVEEYRSLVESTPDAIVRTSLDGRIVATNQRAADLFGYRTPEDMSELTTFNLVTDRDHRFVRENMRKRASNDSMLLNLELDFVRRDGSEFPGEVGSAAVLDNVGAICGTTAVVRNITDRRRIEAELQYQAMHDALTGLPNRILLYDRIDIATKSARRNGKTVTLLLLDLNRFKEVNDSFGHHVGDDLLVEVSARLVDQLRDSDTVARLGGDEFAILLPDTEPADAVVVCDKILNRIRQPYLIQGHQMAVGGSIGLAMCPTHGSDGESLLRCSDVAMYSAKSTMAGYTIYAPELDLHDPHALVLLADLHEAIESNQLELHYQPKVDLGSGAVNSVEALIRWNHPTRGYIPPVEFVPLAERTDIIRSLTLWVLRTAIAQSKIWRANGKNLCVAVNISTWNLHDPSLPNTVASLLSENGVPPNSLKLEITETAVMADPNRAIEVLKRLSAIGVGLSIDDFGTGNTSLSYLRRMPVDEIKIDGSFVQRMAGDSGDAAIVRSVIELGHSLHLGVVAEGVEDIDTLEALRTIQCDQSQGFFLGRPMPLENFEKWLDNWSKDRNTKLPWPQAGESGLQPAA